jgi:hypothetical protein
VASSSDACGLAHYNVAADARVDGCLARSIPAAATTGNEKP